VPCEARDRSGVTRAELDHPEDLEDEGAADPDDRAADVDEQQELVPGHTSSSSSDGAAARSSDICPGESRPARRATGPARRVGPMDASERAAALRAVAAEAAGCVRCALSAGRTAVVFGEGDPDAELALVGEAPGFHEDREGMPFAGRSRDLLAQLLGGIGLRLDEVYLATVLKCR